MASISLDYPDAAQARIVAAMCYAGGWSADMGITKPAFTKQMVASIIRERVREIELEQARAQAVASVTVPTPIDIT